MLDQITGFHIEPTNICTLKCPRCARTKFIEQFPKAWKNKQLNLDQLKAFLDIDLTGKTFALCGVEGDPIYHNQIKEMIEWIKESGAHVALTTNGSYQRPRLWHELSELLDEKDTVTFAVDGTPENFTQYRINGDWDSIKVAMEYMSQSAAHTIWKYIPFSFNKDTIEQARDLCNEIGLSEFVIENSDRWDGEDDPLHPGDRIGDRELARIHWVENTKLDIAPKCKQQHNQHYISAGGIYTPCCYVADWRFYYKSQFHQENFRYDISTTTITKLLNDLSGFYNTLEQDQHSYCTFNCPK